MNTRVLSIVTLAGVIWTNGVVWAATNGQERLLKVDISSHHNYRVLREEKLGVAQFGHIRVIVQPSFAPEYAIGIYSAGEWRRKYWIRYSVFSSNLWQATEVGHAPAAAARVTVKQMKREIPCRTAVLLESIWKDMLSGKGSPRPIEESDVVKATDGTLAEFSIRASDGRVVNGQILNVDLLRPKTKVGRLWTLVRLMVGYCESSGATREEVLQNINENAREERSRLDAGSH